MSELLRKEIIEEVLRSTGAIEGSRLTRVISGDFRRFNFQVKTRSEFDPTPFEYAFDEIAKKIEEEWKENYIETLEVKRNEIQFVDLQKYSLREVSVCCQLNIDKVSDSFFVFFPVKTFFGLLNDYLGGTRIKSEKTAIDLTDIESKLFQHIMERLFIILNNGMKAIGPYELKLTKVGLALNDQRREFRDKYLLAEFSFTHMSEICLLSFALPNIFLDQIKESKEKKGEDESIQLDPLWQKAVLGAFMGAHVDLVVSLGNFNIPFEKSVSLKVGDELTWDKANTQVTVIQDEQPRAVATLGVVEGNFALRVDQIIQ